MKKKSEDEAKTLTKCTGQTSRQYGKCGTWVFRQTGPLYFFCFILGILRFELRALHFLGKHCTA
jgi:hypothetical protein